MTFFRTISQGAAAVATLALLAPAALAVHTFRDVPTNSEFHQYITNLHDKGIVSGVTPTTFEPQRNMSRAEVSKVIVRAKGMPTNTANGPHFPDVATTNEFYTYIETLYNAGVVSGYGSGYFGPSNNVTRGEFSKMVVRAWNVPIDMTGSPCFPDMTISDPAEQYVCTAKNNGIVSGYANGTFGPNNPILRQEVAKMVDLIMGKTIFNPGTGARISVSSSTESAVANCTAPVTFTVWNIDRFGTVDKTSTAVVTVTTNLGTFTDSGTNSQTGNFSNGSETFQLHSCSPGTATVTATSGTMTATDTVGFSQNPNQPANTFNVVASPATLVGDCSTTSVVNYTVRDANGNTLTTFNSPVTATITGAGEFVTNNPADVSSTSVTTRTLTPTDGIGSFTVASCTAGTSTISFQGANVQNGVGTVTYTANPAVTAVQPVSTPTTLCARSNATDVPVTFELNNMSGADLANASFTITSSGTPTLTVTPVAGTTTSPTGQISYTLNAPVASSAGTETLTYTVTPQGGVAQTFTQPVTVQAGACA